MKNLRRPALPLQRAQLLVGACRLFFCEGLDWLGRRRSAIKNLLEGSRAGRVSSRLIRGRLSAVGETDRLLGALLMEMGRKKRNSVKL